MTTTTFPATEKQISFITDLGRELREMAGDDVNRNNVVTIFAETVRDGIDKSKASQLIEGMIELKGNWREDDRKAGRSSDNNGSEPEAGMYRLADGTIVRVYLGQQSGKMLAKKLVSDGDHHEYEYMGKATRFINATTQPLTLEEAKEFGRMTGTCCVCARRLDVPESVEAGIGPVCAGRMEEGFSR